MPRRGIFLEPFVELYVASCVRKQAAFALTSWLRSCGRDGRWRLKAHVRRLTRVEEHDDIMGQKSTYFTPYLVPGISHDKYRSTRYTLVLPLVKNRSRHQPSEIFWVWIYCVIRAGRAIPGTIFEEST